MQNCLNWDGRRLKQSSFHIHWTNPNRKMFLRGAKVQQLLSPGSGEWVRDWKLGSQRSPFNIGLQDTTNSWSDVAWLHAIRLKLKVPVRIEQHFAFVFLMICILHALAWFVCVEKKAGNKTQHGTTRVAGLTCMGQLTQICWAFFKSSSATSSHM